MPVVARDLGAVREYGLAFAVFFTGLLLGTVVSGSWCDASSWPHPSDELAAPGRRPKKASGSTSAAA